MFKTTVLRLFTVSLLLVLISGCYRNCDPSQGGLVDGITCLGSGDYKKRIENRNASLESLRAQNNAQDASNESLESEANFLKQNIAMQQEDLDNLNNNIDGLHQKLTRLRNSKSLDEKKVAELNARLENLESQTSSVISDDLPGSSAGLNNLATKKTELQKEYDELLQMYLELNQ